MTRMIEYNPNPLRRQRPNDDVSLSISKKPKKEDKPDGTVAAAASTSAPAEAPSSPAPDPKPDFNQNEPQHPEKEEKPDKEEMRDYIAWPREILLNDNSSGRGYEKLVEIAGTKRIYTSTAGDRSVNFWRVTLTEEEAKEASKIPEVEAFHPEPMPPRDPHEREIYEFHVMC